MLFLCCIAIASALLSGTYGRSAGPPISTTVMSPVGGVTQYVRVCDQMTPGHSGTSPQNGNGGFYIVSDLTEFGGGYSGGETFQSEPGFNSFLLLKRCCCCCCCCCFWFCKEHNFTSKKWLLIWWYMQ